MYLPGMFRVNHQVLSQRTHTLPGGFFEGELVGTFKKYPAWTCWVKWGQIVSELTMNSHCTRRVSDPLPPVIPAAKAIRLNGVHLPFWHDWFRQSPPGSPLRILTAEPSQFLTPKPLHHWHKQFWDHDVKWSIWVLGADELNFRFSTLQPMVGFKYFKDGVSSLKQVTGRAHRDVERYLVGIIAGKALPPFIIAIRALMDFRYLVQARQLDNTMLHRITSSLQLFHTHKQLILDSCARVGKGNKPMDHFQIPKLELMHGVVPSITSSRAVIQWSANTTEWAHIMEVKVPGRSRNNQSYNPQICRWLDQSEKHQNFSLALLIQTANALNTIKMNMIWTHLIRTLWMTLTTTMMNTYSVDPARLLSTKISSLVVPGSQEMFLLPPYFHSTHFIPRPLHFS